MVDDRAVTTLITRQSKAKASSLLSATKASAAKSSCTQAKHGAVNAATSDKALADSKPSATAESTSAAELALTTTAPSVNDLMEAATKGVKDALYQPSGAGTGPPMVVSMAAVVNAAVEAADTLIAKPATSDFGAGLNPADTPTSARDISQPSSADSSSPAMAPATSQPSPTASRVACSTTTRANHASGAVAKSPSTGGPVPFPALATAKATATAANDTVPV